MMAEWVCYMLGVITGIGISEIANFWAYREVQRALEDYRSVGRS